MDLTEAISSAITGLAAHKLRTFLSMLGMVFGVGAVISMLAIGAGGEQEALRMIEKLGMRNIIIHAKTIPEDKRQEVRKNSLGVSFRDAEAISEAFDQVELAVPRLKVKSYIVLAEGRKTDADVYGVSWQTTGLLGIEMAEGRFFDRREEERHGQVCVIGPAVARALFGYQSALGHALKVNDLWLEVIGVLKTSRARPHRGGTNGSSSQDVTSGGSQGSIGSPAMEIDIPVSTVRRKLYRDPLASPADSIVVHLAKEADPTAVAPLIQQLLDRLHGGEDDFEIVVPAALLEQSRKTQRLFAIVMGSIASISLLVGGIGIMNIMLASVLERVREIGVRRALGARKQDIKIQFVCEAFAISITGGLVGILAGLTLAKVVAAYAHWPTVITPWSVLLAAGVSVTVGLAAGFYPAARAASLRPVEALRHE